MNEISALFWHVRISAYLCFHRYHPQCIYSICSVVLLAAGIMHHVGVKSRAVMDYQMTSNFVYTSGESYFPAWRARLDDNRVIVYEQPYWSASQNLDSWIQIDLMTLFRITGLVIQGHETEYFFLTKCQITYSLGDPMEFIDYKNSTGDVVCISL